MGCSSPSLCRLQRDRECDIWSPSFYVENEMSQIPAAALKMEEKTLSLCVLIFKVMVKKKKLSRMQNCRHPACTQIWAFIFFQKQLLQQVQHRLITAQFSWLLIYSIKHESEMMLWPCIEKIQFCSLENSSRHYPTESTFDPFCCVAIKQSLPLKAAEEERVDNSHEGARLMSVKSMDQNSDWSYFGSTFLGFTLSLSHVFCWIFNHMDPLNKPKRIQETFHQVYRGSNNGSKTFPTSV